METGLLFETRAGPVRLRWNERGLTAIEMPELPPRALRAEFAKQNGTQAPPTMPWLVQMTKKPWSWTL